ncbi:MAG: tetratricopeptide repeat protein [Candidatus Eisenbacteria bacterium]
MNSERWERIHQLVEGALECTPPERREFVVSGSAGDTELCREVLSLLGADVVDELPTHWLGTLAIPDTDRFAPGDRLADRYLIRRLIGRGGMGEVYEADDEVLGITVALKTLRAIGGRDPSSEQLKLEGMLARSVWHPNICRVYELGRHGDDESALWFLAMEPLPGPTLEERLREVGRLPLDLALGFAEQLAGGLGAAHRAGVVHLDLKPANVLLVSRNGVEHAVITDFGIGQALARSDRAARGGRPGAILGTPAFMAPEQLRGEEVGPAADIYALGIVLHLMVTGSLPFSGLATEELIRRKLEEESPAPRDAMPDLDARWDAVIRRCLERDPRRRFARVEHVAGALAGRIQEEPTGLPERVGIPRASLPSERDPFVGREPELVELERARRAGERLLTLVGPGGMGKTRLAIHFGWQTSDAWRGGAWFCDLTEAGDTDGIASAVGVSLGVQLGRGDPIRQLGHAIAGRGPCLIILDNCEQVVAQVAETIDQWRSAAPDAGFLVTSRERLGLEGEHALAVESLPVDEALDLFTLRARGLRPGFAMSGDDADAAREIVRLLDGIPLAIELAAARIRVMSVTQILEGTSHRFRLLAGGGGARHETLERALDGSWELLAPWERAAWEQCAVFESGCTLEAASDVLDLGAWPSAPPTVDVLRSLIDKSLLRSFVPPAEPGEPIPDARFGMYVTLQEYARAKLRSSVDAEAAAERRHGSFYARYGSDEVMESVDRHGGAPQRRRLEYELDNLIGACRRATARGDEETIASTYRAAVRVLRGRGPLGTALALGGEALKRMRLRSARWAGVALDFGEAEWFAGQIESSRTHHMMALEFARESGDPRLEGRVAGPLGRVCFFLGQMDEASEVLEAGMAAARSVNDARALCVALNVLGMMHHELGRSKAALEVYEEALAITRALGDRAQEAVTMVSIGVLRQHYGGLDEAGELFEAALAIYREMGNRRSEGIARLNLGSVRTDQGRLTEARVHAEASLAIARAIGARVGEGRAFTLLGELHTELAELELARSHFERALAIHRELGDRRVEGILVGQLGRLLELTGEPAKALPEYEHAIAIHREVGNRYYEAADLSGLAGIWLALGSRREARNALAIAEPMAREIEARYELARVLCVRAELECAEGDADTAHSALAEAESLAADLDTTGASQLSGALARARRALDGAGLASPPNAPRS